MSGAPPRPARTAEGLAGAGGGGSRVEGRKVRLVTGRPAAAAGHPTGLGQPAAGLLTLGLASGLSRCRALAHGVSALIETSQDLDDQGALMLHGRRLVLQMQQNGLDLLLSLLIDLKVGFGP